LKLNADFYWGLLLSFVFLLILVSGFFGYYIFSKIKNDAILPVESGGQKQTAQKEKLEKVLEYFSAREKKSAEIMNNPSPIVDPSL